MKKIKKTLVIIVPMLAAIGLFYGWITPAQVQQINQAVIQLDNQSKVDAN